MKTFLPPLALAAALAGCSSSTPEPSRDDPRAGAEQASSAAPVATADAPSPTDAPAAAPAGTGTAAAPPAGSAAAAPAGTGSAATAPPGTAGIAVGEPNGRQAKAGWCAKDSDCARGQVCEQGKDEKSCVAGCRSDATCAQGQKCKAVQCVRAPCPSLCQ
jgi:DNA helicase-2/ATP-dependent DNA helicase PcrA